MKELAQWRAVTLKFKKMGIIYLIEGCSSNLTTYLVPAHSFQISIASSGLANASKSFIQCKQKFSSGVGEFLWGELLSFTKGSQLLTPSEMVILHATEYFPTHLVQNIYFPRCLDSSYELYGSQHHSNSLHQAPNIHKLLY